MKSGSNNLELGRISRRALLQPAVASAALGLGFNQVSANEIVNGVTSEHLNEYRPDRDYQLVRRY